MNASKGNKQKASKALLRAGRNSHNPGYKKHIRAHHKRTDAVSALWKRTCLSKGILAAMVAINEVPLEERLYGATYMQEQRLQSMIFEQDAISKRPVEVNLAKEAMKAQHQAELVEKAHEIIENAKAQVAYEIMVAPAETAEDRFRRCELREVMGWLDEAEVSLTDATGFTREIARKYHKARKSLSKFGATMPEAVVVDRFDSQSVYDRLKNQKPVHTKGF